MKKKLLVIAGVAALVAVVGVAALGAVAFAQEPPQKLPLIWTILRHGSLGGGRGGDGFGPLGLSAEEAQVYRGQMQTALAEALDMSVEEFEAAVAEGQAPCEIVEAQGLDASQVWDATQTARQEMLQQAVEDGLLTQRQADWVGERMAEHNPGEWCEEGGGPGSFHGRRGHGTAGPLGLSSEEAQVHRGQMQAALAEALDMSVEELEATVAEGQTPCEIVEAQGLDASQVWEATQTARQEMLQRAVDDGLLSERQADWVGERMAEHSPGQWCSEDGFDLGRQGMKGRLFHRFRPHSDISNQ
jgi:hypothetical protein